MLVKINDQGEIVITGESELEFYALNMWAKEHHDLVNRNEAEGADGGSDKYIVISYHYESKCKDES